MKSIVYLFVEDLDVIEERAALREDSPAHWFTASFVAEVPDAPIAFSPKMFEKMAVTGVAVDAIRVKSTFAGKAIPAIIGGLNGSLVEFLPAVCLKVSAHLSCSAKRRKEFEEAIVAALDVPSGAFIYDGMPEGEVFFEYSGFKVIAGLHEKAGHPKLDLSHYSLYTIPE